MVRAVNLDFTKSITKYYLMFYILSHLRSCTHLYEKDQQVYKSSILKFERSICLSVTTWPTQFLTTSQGQAAAIHSVKKSDSVRAMLRFNNISTINLHNFSIV